MRELTLGNIFIDSTEIIDNLIGKLSEDGWAVNYGNDFHRYHWPDIILSERKLSVSKAKGQDWDTDILGAYCLTTDFYSKKCYEVLEEGYIVLFVNRILDCAKALFPGPQYHKQAVIDLSTIVLIHEFAHWIVFDVNMDSIDPFDKKYFIRNYAKDSDVKDFHEGLAQYFTYFMIHDDKSLKESFNKLNYGQSSPYKKWTELCDANLDEPHPKDIKLILQAMLVYRKLGLTLPDLKPQSFANFTFIVKLLECRDNNNKFSSSLEEYISEFKQGHYITKRKNGRPIKLEVKVLIQTIIEVNKKIDLDRTSSKFGI